MSIHYAAKIDIHDPALYARYEEGFLAILYKYKGRILSAEETPLVREADWSGTRAVILSFCHKEEALAWYNSRDYQELAKFRFDAPSGDVVIVGEIEQLVQGIHSLCETLGFFRSESPYPVWLRKFEPEQLRKNFFYGERRG